MAEHGLQLLVVHARQESGAHGHERVVAAPPGGHGVGRRGGDGPEKRKNAANTRSPERLWPWAASQRWSPSSCAAIDSTRTIARFVARKRIMRFMAELLRFQDGTRPGRRRF